MPETTSTAGHDRDFVSEPGGRVGDRAISCHGHIFLQGEKMDLRGIIYTAILATVNNPLQVAWPDKAASAEGEL